MNLPKTEEPRDINARFMNLILWPEMRCGTLNGGAVGRVGGGTDAARKAAKDDD